MFCVWHASVYICICVHIYVCVRACVLMYVHFACTGTMCLYVHVSVCLCVHAFLCVVLKCELVKVVRGNISTQLHVHISNGGQPMLLLPSMLLVMWCGGSIS